MTKFIVLEIQNGANIVTTFDDRAQAESKYHTVLAAAAISEVEVHTAMLLTNTGNTLEAKCYLHSKEEPQAE